MNAPALIQWQRSYERAALMQASLAMLGFLLGLAAWWWEGRDPRWLAGAFVLLAPWPYTLLVIKPVNDKLKAADPIGAGAADPCPDRALGPLHAGRTALGVLATAIFFCAAMALISSGLPAGSAPAPRAARRAARHEDAPGVARSQHELAWRSTVRRLAASDYLA